MAQDASAIASLNPNLVADIQQQQQQQQQQHRYIQNLLSFFSELLLNYSTGLTHIHMVKEQ
jgi:hypothetical protein